MLTPGKFPCDAWLVTRALRLKKAVLTKTLNAYGMVLSADGTYYHCSELHATRNEAIAVAVAKLEAEKYRHLNAGRRIEQHEKNVNAMFLAAQEGGAT